MPKEIIAPAGVHKPGRYSHAVKVGNLVFLAGQVARDPEGNIVGQGDCNAQAEQIYENMKRILEAAGASLSDVVKITMFFVNIEDLARVAEAGRKYFGHYRVPSTAVQVARLAHPDYLLEVEAIAVIGDG